MINLRVMTEDGIKLQKLELMRFPGGELQFTIDKTEYNVKSVNVQVLAKNSDSIIAMGLVKDAVNHAWPGVPVMLDLLYTPYARQDKIKEGEALATNVFSKIINSYGFQVVQMYDPHSALSHELIEDCIIIDALECFKMTISSKDVTEGEDLFIAPDKGAWERVTEIAKSYDCDVAFSTKIKDEESGEVLAADISNNAYKVVDKVCWVVDDICDTGGTLKAIGKELKDAGAKSIHLVVTHGLFSQGKHELSKMYDSVEAVIDWVEIEELSAKAAQGQEDVEYEEAS